MTLESDGSNELLGLSSANAQDDGFPIVVMGLAALERGKRKRQNLGGFNLWVFAHFIVCESGKVVVV